MNRLFRRPAKGWLRDWRLWIVAAFVAYTLLGFFGVPWLMRSQIPRMTRRYLGREATIREASFNPFTLVTVLKGFELRDRDQSLLLAFEEFSVNLQVSGIFHRTWTFREIRLTGPHVVARIMTDGRLAVSDLFEKKPNQPPEPEAKPGVLPRLRIGHLEIQSGRIDFIDESRAPRFETDLQPLSLEVSGLSTIPDQRGDHVITVGVEGGAEIRWSGRMTVDPLELEGKIDVARLRLPRLWSYAGRSSPIDITSGVVQLSIPYRIEKPAGQAMHAEITDAALDVTGVVARPRTVEEDWLRFGRIEVKGAHVRWPEKTAEAGLVRISDPWVRTFLSQDGQFNWQSLTLSPSSSGASGASQQSGPNITTGPATNAPATASTASGPVGPGPVSASGESSSPGGWKASCAAFEIAGGSADWEDRTITPPVKVSVHDLAARFEGVTSDGSNPVKTQVSFHVDESGAASAGGTLAFHPPAAELEVELSGLDLPTFQPYLSKVANLGLQSGSVGMKAKVSYLDGRKPLVRMEGGGSVDRIALADPGGARVLAWDSLSVQEMRLALQPNRLRVRTVAIQNPFAQILIDREGHVGALKLLKSGSSAAAAPAAGPATSAEPAPDGSQAPEAAPAQDEETPDDSAPDADASDSEAEEDSQDAGSTPSAGPPGAEAGGAPKRAGPAPEAGAPPTGTATASPKGESAFPFEIGSITVHGAKVDYGDQSLILPFATEIHDMDGALNDLSSSGAAGSRLKFEGKVDEYGFAKVEGTIRLFDPYASTELAVLFRNIDMSHLTPYVAQFAGYSIKDGKLDLVINYQIRNRTLIGNHKLTATQLVLGDKVKGGAASLPLRLAVALLKDKDGKIDLEVPIEGSVDSPTFAYRKVIWTAFKRILGNIVAAPFRFLGRLLGIKGHDLQLVSFPAGQSTLLPPEQEKLAKMVEGLKTRPELTLKVAGRYDPVADAAALRESKLEALISQRRDVVSAAAGEDAASVLDQVLEALYAETVSVEAREALRQKHTTVAPAPPGEPPKKSRRGEPAPPATEFDAAGFFRELREGLVAAQTVTPVELSGLAAARAQAIVSVLTAQGAVDPARVTANPPEEVKKKKAAEALIPSELLLPTD